MKSLVPIVIAALTLAGGVPASAHSTPPAAHVGASPTASAATFEARMALRDLWVEHVFWVRSFVVARFADDAAQAERAEAEIVANAKSIGAAIVPFYGEAAGDGLFERLAGHWGAIRGYLDGTLAGSDAGRRRSTDALVANAREIAKFLAGANPNLPEDAVFGLLATHGGHHIAQIDAFSRQNFEAEAENWHAMRRHMLALSDAIVSAIAKQFPDQF